MARRAAAGLQTSNPIRLAFDIGRNAVSSWSCSGKFILSRNLHERPPVPGWIVLSRFGRTGRGERGEIESLAGRGLNLFGIDETIAADPHVVICFGKIRDQVASPVIGNDRFVEFRR